MSLTLLYATLPNAGSLDVSCSAVLCIVAMFSFSYQNRKKVEQCAREGVTPDMEERYADMGDASPLYRFVLHLFLIDMGRVHESAYTGCRYTI